MTRDAEISPKDFLDLVLLQGIYEEDLSVRNSHILTKASSIVTSYLKKENREEWSKKLNDLSKKFLSDPSIQEEEKSYGIECWKGLPEPLINFLI